ncbi:hypothetical protein AGR7A_Cc210218 [Agrobacterium deltaense NCPPB 1641]|uniref:Uncharacterized protein n=1 Tax=Agrobacterium deltaense NCPPB 1641 TaxID=1183425 RepID=A0A1S7TM71_9HYPH|nr:hypothetical protein AGR7A_Cc210218 [Agrobacterium deltaense NCPPB 1641]
MTGGPEIRAVAGIKDDYGKRSVYFLKNTIIGVFVL